MRTTKKFTREELLEILEDGEAVLVNAVEDTSRWSIHYDFVFKHEGHVYNTTYSVGATESQDERPWEYEDNIECVEVKPVEVTVIQYVPI